MRADTERALASLGGKVRKMNRTDFRRYPGTGPFADGSPSYIYKVSRRDGFVTVLVTATEPHPESPEVRIELGLGDSALVDRTMDAYDDALAEFAGICTELDGNVALTDVLGRDGLVPTEASPV